MNRNTIKLHRGVDNELRFRVYNQDRKPVDVQHLQAVMKLTNPQNGEQVLTKYLLTSPEKGYLQLSVSEGELINIAPGFYNMVVLGEEGLVPGEEHDNYRTPFYTDTGNNIVATVEVTASADPGPVPSYVVNENDWRVLKMPGFFQDVNEQHSSAIPGSRVRNHINALHTFAVFADNFTGTLQVYATLELQPPENPNHWFPVDLTTANNFVEFYEYSGSISFSFSANFMWLKFVQKPGVLPEDTVFPTVPDDVGKITKIILR